MPPGKVAHWDSLCDNRTRPTGLSGASVSVVEAMSRKEIQRANRIELPGLQEDGKAGDDVC